MDDILLCEECAGKLDRDLIRQRDWAYSLNAYGVPDSKLEGLRGQVVAQYEKELELIAPKEEKRKKKKHKHKLALLYKSLVPHVLVELDKDLMCWVGFCR